MFDWLVIIESPWPEALVGSRYALARNLHSGLKTCWTKIDKRCKESNRSGLTKCHCCLLQRTQIVWTHTVFHSSIAELGLDDDRASRCSSSSVEIFFVVPGRCCLLFPLWSALNCFMSSVICFTSFLLKGLWQRVHLCRKAK